MAQVLAVADFEVEFKDYVKGQVIDFADAGIVAYLAARKVVSTRASDVAAAIAGGAVSIAHTRGVSLTGGGGFTKNVATGFAETTVGPETFLAIPKAGNNARANINVRTGTFAALSTLVGGNGEIAKCTDQEALFAYDGTTPGGVVFRPDFTKGLLCAVFIADDVSSGGVAKNMSTDTGTAQFAKGNLPAANAAGILTISEFVGWIRITGYIFKSADSLPGASHQLLVMTSDAIGGPYTEGYALDLPPTLTQVPVNVLFPAAALGASPAYVRFALRNSSAEEVLGNAVLAIEYLA